MLFPLFPLSVKMKIFYLTRALMPLADRPLFGLKALDDINLSSPSRPRLNKGLEPKISLALPKLLL